MLTPEEKQATAVLVRHLEDLAAWHHGVEHQRRAIDIQTPTSYRECEHDTCKATWANIVSVCATLGVAPRE